MRIAIGVDWSDQAFQAITQTFHVYHPTDVTLVHGVNLGFFEQPLIAGAANLQGYDDFRNAMVDSGRQLLERTAAMIPSNVESVRKINEIGSPAQVILDGAHTVSADLVVVGARGRSRVTETVLGSVSHRVLSHGSRPTLIVKGPARQIQRVLVAVEGQDDADRITQWLTRHQFATPVELSVLNVVVPVGLDSPYDALGAKAWWEGAERYAEEFVKTTAAKLLDSRYTVSTKVAVGNPAAMVEEQAQAMDLVVVASHGRKGIDRFLLGSVSHAIVHQVSCPVLVIR
ncbi:MAG: universal stress protein [Nitrospira sp.]|nr:universal stress protein [Nitrospira sp.]MDH5252236.1 universal stress protein [Nitrospira sp.]MDH5625593.1 universal stress protein [Nitrospira sp.]